MTACGGAAQAVAAQAGESLGQARTLLFVPADRPERFAKALAAGADAVIVDLEDAVRSEAKPGAARSVRDAWPALVAAGHAPKLLLRINAAGTPWHADDVALCAALRPAAVVVPKAESTAALQAVADRLGGDPRVRRLLPLIESAAGLAAVRAIAGAPAVIRLLLGHLDLQADLGMACGDDERELDAVRLEIVLASRLAHLPPPVDGVTVDIDNPQRLGADVQRARRFGFGGKLCIHPRQVAPVHAALAPTPEQRAWARRVLDAAAAAGGGAVQVDGRMVDAPVLALAERLLPTRADR